MTYEEAAKILGPRLDAEVGRVVFDGLHWDASYRVIPAEFRLSGEYMLEELRALVSWGGDIAALPGKRGGAAAGEHSAMKQGGR